MATKFPITGSVSAGQLWILHGFGPHDSSGFEARVKGRVNGSGTGSDIVTSSAIDAGSDIVTPSDNATVNASDKAIDRARTIARARGIVNGILIYGFVGMMIFLGVSTITIVFC